MSSRVSWTVQFAIRDGQLDNLRALIPEMAEQTKANERGTLRYQWSINEDGTVGHIHERYEDSDAALTHLATFNERYAERFMSIADSIRMFVYENPSEALMQQLAGAVRMETAGGFTRNDG